MALNKTQQFRIRIVAAAVAIAFIATLGRLYQIQCLQHEKFVNLAASQHHTRITIPVRRGTIADVNGNPLAISLPVQSLYADPELVENKSVVAYDLAPILKMQPQDVFMRLIRGKRFSWIKRKLTQEEYEQVAALKVKGLGFRREYRRAYPQNSMLGQVIGFVGIDDEGLSGLENYLEPALTGEPGYRIARRDASGTSFSAPELETVPGLDGHDIFLTIDTTIQLMVEEELRKTAAEWRAQRASAVMMDTATGDILALANCPEFNPNMLGRLSAAELRRLNRNSAVIDVFEPGSIFKAFTMSAAIQERVIKADTIIDCEAGVASINGRRLRDTRPHGKIPASQVIICSSNIGMAKIAAELGKQNLYEYVTLFGFGSRTGLPVAGEPAGIFAAPQRWSKYTISSVPMGQEVAVTPVQMVAGYSAIANNGMLMRPRLISKVVDPNTGVVVARSQPKAVRQIVSPATARIVTDMLVQVVEHENGTGRRVRLDGYCIAGKTGTAQKSLPGTRGYSSTDYISSFIAFAPAYQPRVCVLVVIDTPRGYSHYGGTVAAPPVREILRRTLAYLNVPPELNLANSDLTQTSMKPDSTRPDRNGGEL